MFSTNHTFISVTFLFGLLLFPPLTPASDLEREQRLQEQIVDVIMDGEALELEADGHQFLAIHTESTNDRTRGGAIILHGRGLHPDWEDVVQPLRVGLTEQGWHTLAIQLPVLDKQAKYYDYEPILAEATPRIEAAINYLSEQGVARIVLIAHSCGAHMAMQRVREHGDTGLDAYIGIGMGATDYQQPMRQPFPLDRMSTPILDIYAENDFPAVLRMAPERLALIEKAGNPQSRQIMIADTEHYFSNHGDALLKAISGWLNGLAWPGE